ncbi:MAG: hypothetical protein ACOY4K_07480 [Pseudomonadota bacterium]
MTALACLRILIDADRAAAGGEALAALVGKVASAYLETRWRWPRRHGEIAPYAFLLADPRATQLDAGELTLLSDELHRKLFGESAQGHVDLVLLEGEQNAVTCFAAIDAGVLRKVVAEGGEIEGVPGRITQVTRDGFRVVSPEKEAGPHVPVDPAAVARRALPTAEAAHEVAFRAVWCALKDSFIGSGLSARRKGARVFMSIIDSPAEAPPATAVVEFDTSTLKAAGPVLGGVRGLLFLPVSFSSAIHRQTRDSYVEALESLPAEARPRLAAAVYDVPRAPSFAAVKQLTEFLSPYFSFVDLQTADPAFAIEALAAEAVNSVTLKLPEGDEGARLAAAARFLANRDAYQRRRIWPAITNVRTRRELDYCVQQKTPFLSGKAVSDHLHSPVEPARFAASQLPVRDGARTGTERDAVLV